MAQAVLLGIRHSPERFAVSGPGRIPRSHFEGHSAARELWGRQHPVPISLEDAVQLCRQCHRLAPFCFYNGNTFAGIIRDVIQGLGLPPDQSYVVRSLAGHIVAGVSTGEEERAFLEFCNSLENQPSGPTSQWRKRLNY